MAQLIKKIVIFCFLFCLFILPFNLHIFNINLAIFPALDLIIIYYISTHKKIYYPQLFIIGIFLDQLYTHAIGINALFLIIADLILKQVNKLCLVKKYEINIIIFFGYALFIIVTRYCFITILSVNYIEGNAIIFYYLTTIFSYPIMYIILDKFLRKLD